MKDSYVAQQTETDGKNSWVEADNVIKNALKKLTSALEVIVEDAEEISGFSRIEPDYNKADRIYRELYKILEENLALEDFINLRLPRAIL